jgi:hypothetical protein
MTHALRASVLVWRKIEHVRPSQTTQCIPYELLLHTLYSIDVYAIERPPHTTGVFKLRVHKDNIKGLESIRVRKEQIHVVSIKKYPYVPKNPRDLIHKPNEINRVAQMAALWNAQSDQNIP